MTGGELVVAMEATGATVTLVDGGRINIKRGGAIPKSLIERVQKHRPEVVAYLRQRQEAGPPADVSSPPARPHHRPPPVSWVEGVAAMQTMPPPSGFTAQRWAEARSDAVRLLARYGGELHAKCWTTEDVFGVHPDAPAHRYSALGLVFLIHGGSVPFISGDKADIVTRAKVMQTHPRAPHPEAVAVWKLKPR